MVDRSVRHDLGVSAREAEVLAAVGEHLTNAEIAAKLFISGRTVETHVSSLLRKFQVDDRRALGALARAGAGTQSAGRSLGPASKVAAVLPTTLTPFVGRVTERAALARDLQSHRLVTAVGPGGVGKTRLALRVAADMTDHFADGVWFVDLVAVTEPAMVAAATCAALGLGEGQQRSEEDTLLRYLANRETLLVLDNCEHLLDGVVPDVERLLAGCPRLVVLATSRARLLVPFERVYLVPGLSTEPGDAGAGDAVALFLERVAAVGTSPTAEDLTRLADICRSLDGIALAIELAAARFASLGLPGLEAGLADRLLLLSGGARLDHRHRSLRSALDWSYTLLDGTEQAVLRRIAAFAAPFTARQAEAVAGWAPVLNGAIPTILGALADQSLLVVVAGSDGTRYRALETVRHYAAERLEQADEALEAHERHLDWCLDTAATLEASAGVDLGSWRLSFDRVADELRAGLGWPSDQPRLRPKAYQLATALASLCFARGMPGETQRRYEQAAALADGDGDRARSLRAAAGAAASRHFGDDALRLRRAAADAALRGGFRAAAAWDLASAAELIARRPGIMATPPPIGELNALLNEAWVLAAGDPAAEARVFTSQAFVGDDIDPVTADLAQRAVELARRVGDPLTESAALDQLISVELAQGDIGAAAASAALRAELVRPLRPSAVSGLELADALYMATECAVAIGDLRVARELAERIQDLPFHREEGHLATARLLVVTVLAGDWDEAAALSDLFREGWEQAGRPRAGNLTRGAYAAATVHGLRGDAPGRAAWLEIVHALVSPVRPLSEFHFGEFFDAMLLLHQGFPAQAMQQLQVPPETFRAWHNGIWRPWYAALWAEAAVLSRHAAAADRIDRARLLTIDNPIATAIVDRAAALHQGEGAREQLVAAAAFDGAGCRYQWARTLVLIGAKERVQGEAVLTAMGATRMVTSESVSS